MPIAQGKVMNICSQVRFTRIRCPNVNNDVNGYINWRWVKKTNNCDYSKLCSLSTIDFERAAQGDTVRSRFGAILGDTQ